MEQLRNLEELYTVVTQNFSQYDGKEFVLPKSFREQVKEIDNSTVVYYEYSAVINTKKGLSIYLPNQWFYIASYFTELYNELQRYKQETIKVVSSERLKSLNGSSLSENEKQSIQNLSLDEISKSYLERFMTDYSWWNGAKTIDRGDFYVSPILNCAKLVNVSQSYIADLCAFLADKKDLVDAIIHSAEDVSIKNAAEQNSRVFQQIFYGAPGTGKSNTIKREVDEKKKKNFRVTFHPDSDYSTFVGCYKPTKKPSERIYTKEELVLKLNEIKTSGTTYPCQKFGAKYWESLKELSAKDIKEILSACEYTDNFSVEIAKGVGVGQECLSKYDTGKITYEFVPQAFTKAYIEAWNTEEDVYLIIEEINRGNCAQIFGDLFQLLDRKDGVSEYPVDADADLQNHLSEALAETTRTDIPEEVKSGKKLMLPSNLYIWATMNTSDQSLFPIDSAFKRRWNWKYIKIKNHPEEDYKIKIGEDGTDWWAFIQKINEIIASMTSSADKQLGYFFCKAKDGEIDEETFVSKVIFYLWNDVFKDYGFEDASLFRYTDKDGVEKDLTFPDFYDEDGEKVDTERLADFVNKVLNWKKIKE